MTFVLNMSRTFSHNEVKFSKIKQKISKHSQDIDKIKTRQRQVKSSLLPLHYQDMLPLRPLLGSNSNSIYTVFYTMLTAANASVTTLL